MIPVFDQLDLRDPDSVIRILESGAAAAGAAPGRVGSCEHATCTVDAADAGARLILSGDLHDHPLHLARLLRAARMDVAPGSPRADSHITLHELIHGDRLMNGMDFSYRVLCRAAALKSAWPAHVHILLANHELSQVVGSGIVKDGVRVVEAFNAAVEYTFGDDAPRITQSVNTFIRSLPLAVRFHLPAGDVLCSHSLPAPEMMERFDPSVLDRELVDDDLAPRKGSAQLMVWGRDHQPDQLRALARTWNVALFVLGHEKAEQGYLALPPNALVLNSDHDRGMFVQLDARENPSLSGAMESLRPLGAE